jgi:hypothetical protein
MKLKMQTVLGWATFGNWLSVGAATFAGGAVGYLQASLVSDLASGVPWRSIAIGAVAAGVIAVAHLAQVPPTPPAPAG